MGLTIYAKGLSEEETYDCGYLTFFQFRKRLAYTYHQEIGEMYEKMTQIWGDNELTKEEIERWNEICNDALDNFLFHSDCDGKLTWKECREIYKAIEPLKMEMIGHNYGVMKEYNMLEHWKNMFKHCWKRRVNMYFM